MTESTKTSLTQKNQKNPQTMRKLGGKILWKHPSLWTNPIGEKGEMEKNPSKIFNQLYDFLDIKKFEIDFKKHNVAKYNEMNQDTRNELIEYFKPYNKKLYELIGRKFDWEN